jgi:hypothetical protein
MFFLGELDFPEKVSIQLGQNLELKGQQIFVVFVQRVFQTEIENPFGLQEVFTFLEVIRIKLWRRS